MGVSSTYFSRTSWSSSSSGAGVMRLASSSAGDGRRRHLSTLAAVDDAGLVLAQLASDLVRRLVDGGVHVVGAGDNAHHVLRTKTVTSQVLR